MKTQGAYVEFLLPGGRVKRAVPSALFGPAPNAEVGIDDPRVSEAHASVSFRKNGMRLHALRGDLWLDKRASRDIKLFRGAKVLLTPPGDPDPVVVEVRHIESPDEVPAVRVGAMPAQALHACDYSLVHDGESIRLTRSRVAGASAVLTPLDGDWLLERPDEAPVSLLEEPDFDIDGTTIAFTSVQLEAANTERNNRIRSITVDDSGVVYLFSSRPDKPLIELTRNRGYLVCHLARHGPLHRVDLEQAFWPTADEQQRSRRFHTLKYEVNRIAERLTGQPIIVLQDGTYRIAQHLAELFPSAD